MFSIRKLQEDVILQAVAEKSSSEIAKEVVFGAAGKRKQESDPEWVKATMQRLEDRFDADEVKAIRMNCQCGYGMDEKLALLRELMTYSADPEKCWNTEKAKEAGLFYRDGAIYLQFFFCPCPMLAEVDRLATRTWCECTTGYSKVLFEKALDCDVDVELLKSIKAGDEICLMRIIPRA